MCVDGDGRREDSGIEGAPVKAIAKRLSRLEDRFAPAERKPRDYFRIVLIRLDRIPGLEGATCHRTWWPNHTVHESVVLGRSSDSHELTKEELDQWVAGFPIEAEDGIRCIPITALKVGRERAQPCSGSGKETKSYANRRRLAS
jgi:hypothetical protein